MITVADLIKERSIKQDLDNVNDELVQLLAFDQTLAVEYPGINRDTELADEDADIIRETWNSWAADNS